MTGKRTLLITALLLLVKVAVWGQNQEGNLRIEASASVDELVAQKKEYNKLQNSYPGYKMERIRRH